MNILRSAWVTSSTLRNKHTLPGVPSTNCFEEHNSPFLLLFTVC